MCARRAPIARDRAEGFSTDMTVNSPDDPASRQVPQFVLALSSPRRRQLVAELRLDVETLGPNGFEEPPTLGETPEDYTLRLAEDKAGQGAALRPGSFVIGADTCVVFRGEILGKPIDAADAIATLQRLRGAEHSVVTGVCVRATGVSGSSVSDALHKTVRRTQVWMRDYSDDEIDTYVESGRAFDKAGSYAIQDSDFHPVDRFVGCYLNVVGFPLCALVETLAALGVRAELRRPEHTAALCGGCELTGGGA